MQSLTCVLLWYSYAVPRVGIPCTRLPDARAGIQSHKYSHTEKKVRRLSKNMQIISGLLSKNMQTIPGLQPVDNVPSAEGTIHRCTAQRAGHEVIHIYKTWTKRSSRTFHNLPRLFTCAIHIKANLAGADWKLFRRLDNFSPIIIFERTPVILLAFEIEERAGSNAVFLFSR